MVCYSRQKSKTYLVKDENCDNELYWASDVEQAVINQLFSFEYLGHEDRCKELPYLDPRESLLSQIKQAKKQLNRLYELFEDNAIEEDVLKERINQKRTRIAELEELLSDAEKQSEIDKKVYRAKGILRTLKSTWDAMNQEERQTVCRELIERVTIHKNNEITVQLKLGNYCVKTNN